MIEGGCSVRNQLISFLVEGSSYSSNDAGKNYGTLFGEL